MGLYRASPRDGVAWVTGASRGIGRALALELAADGYTVAATARDAEILATLAETKGMAGRIVAFPADVTEEFAMLHTIRDIERGIGPIALAVLNAGSYFPTRGERLDINSIAKTFEVNFFGVLNGLIPIVDLMRSRDKGQIMLIGSASSFFGWPSASAYGASKAALNNLAEALTYDFDRMNIRLQVVHPGFVETQLTERNTFRMPFRMTAEKAAKRIAAIIRKGGFKTSFPRRFTILLMLIGMLPYAWRFALINRLTGWKERPLAAERTPRSSK